MDVPFVDLRKQYESIRKEINQGIQNVIHESAFIGGIYVKTFESYFADFCGAKFCVGTGNGTDSIYIAAPVKIFYFISFNFYFASCLLFDKRQ